MLPYFEEYKEYLLENCNKDSAKTQTMRLVKLDRAEKSLLEMTAEEMFVVIEADKKAKSTLYNECSTIEIYLKWLKNNHNVFIFDCYYQSKKLKLMIRHNDNLSDNYFSSFAEMKKVLLQAEEEYLQCQEGNISEEKLDTIYLKQKMFNAYATFSWEQIKDDEMLALSLKETMSIITSKQIVVNKKLISLSDDEVNFISEAFDAVSELHQEIDDRKYRSKIKYNRSLKMEVYDNLFNASNINILKNLKWNALGRVTDKRLQIQNITKSGIFSKLRQYELENDYIFSGVKSFKVCSDVLGVSITTAQRLCTEYDKFKRSLENKNKDLSETI